MVDRNKKRREEINKNNSAWKRVNRESKIIYH